MMPDPQIVKAKANRQRRIAKRRRNLYDSYGALPLLFVLCLAAVLSPYALQAQTNEWIPSDVRSVDVARQVGLTTGWFRIIQHGAAAPAEPLEIAILDTGVDDNIADLQKVSDRVNFTDEPVDQTNPDPGSHGTAMASIICAHANDPVSDVHAGIAGILGVFVQDARLLDVKVIKSTDESAIPGDRVADALNYLNNRFDSGHHILAANLSLNCTDTPKLRAAIMDAATRKIILFCAAGNSGTEVTADSGPFPAGYSKSPGMDNVVAVGGVDHQNFWDPFTDFSPQLVAFAGPSRDVPVDLPFAGGVNGNACCSSAATAMVCGIYCAIRIYIEPDPDVALLRLEQTCTPIADTTPRFRFGIPNLGAALDPTFTPVQPQTPVIANVTWARKDLTITGDRFGSSPKILINGVDRTSRLVSESDTEIVLHTKAKKLGLKSGENNIQVFDSTGAASNTFVLTL